MTFISYYIIGLPVGILLGFLTSLNILGVWIGMMIGNIFHVSLFSLGTPSYCLWDDNYAATLLHFYVIKFCSSPDI